MGQVTLTFNGRTYTVGCGDGEEERLRAIGAHVRDKLERLVREFGQAGEARLFLLTALVVADELLEARKERDTAASTAAAAVLREMAERSRPEPRKPEDDGLELAQLPPRPQAELPLVASELEIDAEAPSAESARPAPQRPPRSDDAAKPGVSALQAAINRGTNGVDATRR